LGIVGVGVIAFGVYLMAAVFKGIFGVTALTTAVGQLTGALAAASFAAKETGASLAVSMGASATATGGALSFPPVAIGILAAAAAFLALGAGIWMAGKGIELMKGLSSETVVNLAKMIPVLLGIGGAAHMAAAGLAEFSLAAIPAMLAGAALSVSGVGVMRPEGIDYQRMKTVFKEALSESSIKTSMNGVTIESTPVYVSSRKFAEITHKVINETS